MHNQPTYKQCDSKESHSVHEHQHRGVTYRCPGCAAGGKTLTLRF